MQKHWETWTLQWKDFGWIFVQALAFFEIREAKIMLLSFTQNSRLGSAWGTAELQRTVRMLLACDAAWVPSCPFVVSYRKGMGLLCILTDALQRCWGEVRKQTIWSGHIKGTLMLAWLFHSFHRELSIPS